MATVAKLMATAKRARARAARGLALSTRVVEDKEGNGEGSKSNDGVVGNEEGDGKGG
jgi:hypothetical protein